ncbi:MAG: YqgE/AlgH family protein [Lysobacterales bacterium]
MHSEPSWLTNHLLIAMPGLQDPGFAHSLTYICQHNAEGAMGLVVNRAANLPLAEILEQLGVTASDRNALARITVLSGGPVQPERGFVLHTPLPAQAASAPLDSSVQLTPALCLTTSRDVLPLLADGKNGPNRALLALGYAGWSAGQLEQELRENAWLTVAVDDLDILFDAPLDRRWQLAVGKLGFDPTHLSWQAGHA